MITNKFFTNLFILGFIFLNFNLFATDFSKAHSAFSKTKTWIERLATNESFSIILDSQGCFNSYQDTIVIERKEDKYFFNSNNQHKELSQKDIELINSFEIELNKLKPGSCTTINTYTIKYKDEITKIVDSNCFFIGIELLKNEILNIKLKNSL